MYDESIEVQRRFWSHVKPSTINFYNGSACLEWQGGKDLGGYGMFSDSERMMGAHRYAMDVFYKKIKPGLQVHHHCDNPPCINPAHLWQGTPQENTNDMMSKGRGNAPKGSKCIRSKLTEEQVRQIRKDYKWFGKDNNAYALARKYGLSNQAMHDIVSGKSWKHVME